MYVQPCLHKCAHGVICCFTYLSLARAKCNVIVQVLCMATTLRVWHRAIIVHVIFNGIEAVRRHQVHVDALADPGCVSPPHRTDSETRGDPRPRRNGPPTYMRHSDRPRSDFLHAEKGAELDRQAQMVEGVTEITMADEQLLVGPDLNLANAAASGQWNVIWLVKPLVAPPGIHN